MQARYYDPSISRFLSTDPAVYAPGMINGYGRYQYASSNPYRFTDPTGMVSCGSGMSTAGCAYPEPRIRGEMPSSSPFALSSNAEPPEQNGGCDTSECDEVRQTRANIMRDQADALEKAGAFGAKEGAMMMAGGLLGKLVGRVAGALRISERVAVTFGRNENQVFHAFRHIEEAGLSRKSVSDAVMTDLAKVSRQIQSGQLYRGTVQVDGVEVTYNAFRTPAGSINVGRITTPETSP